MTEKKTIYLCQKCHTLLEKETGLKCSRCGSHLVNLDVSCKNPNIDESGPPPWEYVCHYCKAFFRQPVPRGPDEAKNISCPECGGRNIERFRTLCLEDIEHPFG